MPPLPAEGQAQHELLLLLRALIDKASLYPTFENVQGAVAFAQSHPRALRSSHFAHLLGVRRWGWLESQGVYPIFEPVEIAGSFGVKGTIEPDVTA